MKFSAEKKKEKRLNRFFLVNERKRGREECRPDKGSILT